MAEPRFTTNDPAQPRPDLPSQLTGLATLVLRLDGHVTGWSSGAARLFGISSAQALGQDIRDLLGERHRDTAEEALAEAADGRACYGVLPTECAGGHLHAVEFRSEPMAGADTRPSVMVAAAAAPAPDAGTVVVEAAASREGLALLNEASTRIGSTLDLGRTANEVVDVAVPRFADAAGVFVMERLIADDEFPDREADGSVVVRRLAVGSAGTDPAEWAAAFPADDVTVYPADTPYARCVATGTPISFTTAGTSGAARTGPDRKPGTIEHLLDGGPRLVVPLKARGKLLGFAVFAWKLSGYPSSPPRVALAGELAARAAICIDNARLYHRERRIALALRRSLLPKSLTVPPGVEIARRYLPAGDTTQVGGDWYDVVALPGGRVALVVGDATGHGTEAAAGMIQLRTAVRTLAGLGLSPTEVLARLDEMAQSLPAAQFATCVYATCDPATGVCAIARAGHIPPILAHADGTTDVLGLPLGIGDVPFETTEVKIRPGSTLVLCTDGLVESREHDIDSGIAILRAALSGPHPSLEATCDAVVAALRGRYDEDDITVLLARVNAVPAAGVRGGAAPAP